VDVSLFCVDAGLFCVNIHLFCVDTGLFCVDVATPDRGMWHYFNVCFVQKYVSFAGRWSLLRHVGLF